ncbi:unnamed protein product [Fusarium fujikuroi]|nr:unnamed protein product [Fusarium fujikuroi]
MAPFLVTTEYSPLSCLAAAAAAVVTFQLLRAVYRLYFHPLSKFPGPRSAAISRQWQANIVKKGFPEKEYEKLHKQFGTKALRIGPNHLHISDSSLYKVIYSQANPFPKEQAFYDTFESHHTTFSETDAQLHKQRRKLLSPLFSKSGVSKLEQLILEKVEETKEKVNRISKHGPINMWPAFRCMTVDIISEFSFGTCINMINEDPDTFNSEYLKAMEVASALPFLRYYSTMQWLLGKCVPISVAANFSPILRQTEKMVGIIVDSYHNYAQRTTNSRFPVLFDNLQTLPADSQKAEAINTFIAGSDTTAFTLVTALYHILRLPEVEKTLTASLDELFGGSQSVPSLVQLEQTKYLTVVGMSAYTMNTDPQIWGQDAHSFNPARWLGPNAKELETHMCTFSKGARQCIGINVAYAEATIALAHFFYNFKMELKTKELRVADKFTIEAPEPGLLVDFKLRQHS